MKHKICSILLSLIILIGAAGFFPAAAEPDTADRVTGLVSGIAAYMEASDGSHSLQELLDGFISSYAGSGGEWFAIALKQAHPELDYSAYTKALLNVKETRKLPKLTDRQLISLALIFMDHEDDPLVLQTAEENPAENGLMSHVFGLHLLNNLDMPEETRCHALELLDLR
ncbi:MAG: hypothetical protein IIY77_03330, partial [Lachnospiraceae bacterium]|nr:hypothetical protein [Lachnospiraceae bacterium]